MNAGAGPATASGSSSGTAWVASTSAVATVGRALTSAADSACVRRV